VFSEARDKACGITRYTGALGCGHWVHIRFSAVLPEIGSNLFLKKSGPPAIQLTEAKDEVK
jgi:hypothetical protein